MTGADARRPSDARLSAALYEKLRVIAQAIMRSERADHTLQPTALIHEAYLKLSRVDDTIVDDEHFLSLAAIQMRRVLVDAARARRRLKRRPEPGRLQVRMPDDADLGQLAPHDPDDLADQLLQLEDGLRKLESVSPRRARLVELRFFGGLSVPDAARALGLSERTAARDWKLARLFLRRVLAAAD